MPVAPMVVAPAVDESTFEMTSQIDWQFSSRSFKVRLLPWFLQLFQREVFVLRRQRRLRRATTSGRSTTIQIRTSIGAYTLVVTNDLRVGILEETL